MSSEPGASQPNLSISSAFRLSSKRFFGRPVVVIQSDTLWVRDKVQGWCHIDFGHVSVVERETKASIDCLVIEHRIRSPRQHPCACNAKVFVALTGLTSRQRTQLGRVLVSELQRTRITLAAQDELGLPRIHLSHG